MKTLMKNNNRKIIRMLKGAIKKNRKKSKLPQVEKGLLQGYNIENVNSTSFFYRFLICFSVNVKPVVRCIVCGTYSVYFAGDPNNNGEFMR